MPTSRIIDTVNGNWPKLDDKKESYILFYWVRHADVQIQYQTKPVDFMRMSNEHCFHYFQQKMPHTCDSIRIQVNRWNYPNFGSKFYE
ncbi:hypothetical protein ACTXT7_006887 [Hymenolepis weldensis]